MVHNKKPNLDDYWSKDPLQKNPVCNVMSRDRYQNILRLQFSDNTQPHLYGMLSKIKEVVDCFMRSFSNNFNPFRNLCIDESLLLYKGHLGFKQFIPSKRSRFGIKMFLLCYCDTDYVLDIMT